MDYEKDLQDALDLLYEVYNFQMSMELLDKVGEFLKKYHREVI